MQSAVSVVDPASSIELAEFELEATMQPVSVAVDEPLIVTAPAALGFNARIQAGLPSIATTVLLPTVTSPSQITWLKYLFSP